MNRENISIGTFGMVGTILGLMLVGTNRAEALLALNLNGDVTQTTQDANEPTRTRAQQLAATLDDPFAYDPFSPTNPLPFQTINTLLDGYKAFNGIEGPVVVAYTWGTAISDTFFDLYGRDNCCSERDNGLVVKLYNGDWTTPVFTSAQFDISDSAPFYARFTTPANITADRVSITGPDFFTLMEIRGNAVPEPTSSVLVALGLAGVRFLRRKTQGRS